MCSSSRGNRAVLDAEQALGDLIERTRTLTLVDEVKAKCAAAGRTVLGEGLSRVSGRLGDDQRNLQARLESSAKSIDRDQLTKQLGDALGSAEVAHDAGDEDDGD